jgi:hypothetical protein
METIQPAFSQTYSATLPHKKSGKLRQRGFPVFVDRTRMQSCGVGDRIAQRGDDFPVEFPILRLSPDRDYAGYTGGTGPAEYIGQFPSVVETIEVCVGIDQ